MFRLRLPEDQTTQGEEVADVDWNTQHMFWEEPYVMGNVPLLGSPVTITF